MQEIPEILVLVVLQALQAHSVLQALQAHSVLRALLVPLDATGTMETMELTTRIHLVFLEMMIRVHRSR